MRSRHSDSVFKAAAQRLFPMVTVGQWASVERLADGGAYVEVQVFVPEADARAQAEPDPQIAFDFTGVGDGQQDTCRLAGVH